MKVSSTWKQPLGFGMLCKSFRKVHLSSCKSRTFPFLDQYLVGFQIFAEISEILKKNILKDFHLSSRPLNEKIRLFLSIPFQEHLCFFNYIFEILAFKVFNLNISPFFTLRIKVINSLNLFYNEFFLHLVFYFFHHQKIKS